MPKYIEKLSSIERRAAVPKPPKLPFGTKVVEYRDKTIYHYPSGKKYVKHKSKSQIYGKAYDWSSDG